MDASHFQSVVRVLTEKWERRVALMEKNSNPETSPWVKGLVDAHKDCLEDLRAEAGKHPKAALNHPEQKDSHA
jgi:hypothetical protein